MIKSSVLTTYSINNLLTFILFSVKVPVLSEQILLAPPIISPKILIQKFIFIPYKNKN